MSEVKDAVARGAALLDRKRRGWALRIDQSRLRTGSFVWCVLSQTQAGQPHSCSLTVPRSRSRGHPPGGEDLFDEACNSLTGNHDRDGIFLEWVAHHGFLGGARFDSAWRMEVDRRVREAR